MTEVDELLARLRKLPAVSLDSEFKASLHARARRRVQGPGRPAPLVPFASLALAVTAVLYLGWALQFAGALYR
jgi:type VI protein secretion system component VasF